MWLDNHGPSVNPLFFAITPPITADARGLTDLSFFLPAVADVMTKEPDRLDVPLRPRLRELDVPPVTADLAPARLLSLLSGAAAQRSNLCISSVLCRNGWSVQIRPVQTRWHEPLCGVMAVHRDGD